jgi:RimJ/RimL family protein N-acetyltransferase
MLAMKALETPRLQIRPFILEDIDEAYQLLDVDLAWSGPGFSIEQRTHRLQFYISLAEWSDASHLFGYRAIRLKETAELAGIVGFVPCLEPPEKLSLFGTRATDAQEHRYSSLEVELGASGASGRRLSGATPAQPG